MQQHTDYKIAAQLQDDTNIDELKRQLSDILQLSIDEIATWFQAHHLTTIRALTRQQCDMIRDLFKRYSIEVQFSQLSKMEQALKPNFSAIESLSLMSGPIEIEESAVVPTKASNTASVPTLSSSAQMDAVSLIEPEIEEIKENVVGRKQRSFVMTASGPIEVEESITATPVNISNNTEIASPVEVIIEPEVTASYRLVFSGRYDAALNSAEAIQRLAHLFNVEMSKAQLFFDGTARTLKDQLTETEAKQYQQYFATQGLYIDLERSQIESAVMPTPVVKSPNVIQQPQIAVPEKQNSSARYQLIFSGEYANYLTALQAREAFAQLFQKQVTEIAHFFNGAAHVLVKDLTQEQVNAYATAFQQAGLNLSQQPMTLGIADLTSNMYQQSMSEEEEDEEEEYCSIKGWFDFDSRLNPIQYLAMLSVPMIVNLLAPLAGMGAAMVISVITLVASLSLMVRRLHDFNVSGWWVLALPLVYIILYMSALVIFLNLPLLLLAALPSTKGSNSYGFPPPPTEKKYQYAAIVCVVLMLVGSYLSYQAMNRFTEELDKMQTQFGNQTPAQAQKQAQEFLDALAKGNYSAA